MLKALLLVPLLVPLVLAAPASTYGCPARDTAGHTLDQAHQGTYAFAVSCQYEGGGICYYKKTGQFSTGPSTCPTTISQSQSTSHSALSSASNSNGCPAKDASGTALTKTLNGHITFALACQYGSSEMCYYDKTGKRTAGATSCPSSVSAGTANNSAAYKSSSLATESQTSYSSSISCPATDTANGALLSLETTTAGFIDCTYTSGGCQYFASNGTYLTGTSFCPLTISGHVSTQVSATTQCPTTDSAGSPLTSSGHVQTGFVLCSYVKSGDCEYFSNGTYANGASQCPSAIPGPSGASGSASANAAAGAYTSSSTALPTCAPTDDNSSPLLKSSVSSDGFVECQYKTAGTCEYFIPNGQFSSGSSVCPDSIAPAATYTTSSSSPTTTTTTTTLPVCAPTDKSGSHLLKDTVSSDGFLECEYKTAGTCEYFIPNGEFSSGGSVCPPSATASSAGNKAGVGSSWTTTTTTGKSESASTTTLPICAMTDKSGSHLLRDTVSSDGFLECKYKTAGTCEYFIPNGEFSSGGSVCPGSATASSVGGAAADLASSNSNSSSSSSSSSTNPVYIALIVMNTVLVIGILTVGFLWIRQHRVSAASKAGQLKVLYAKVDAARDEMSMPFTPLPPSSSVGQSSSSVQKEKYYDPHDPQARILRINHVIKACISFGASVARSSEAPRRIFFHFPLNGQQGIVSLLDVQHNDGDIIATTFSFLISFAAIVTKQNALDE
uniref:Uncharacterized protein n=1 Tax=Mycena chlorophos TaxID=658473 RepID=A0ABQ0LB63_MYCCL|nr:predicted protein [Mycena chlorophos]